MRVGLVTYPVLAALVLTACGPVSPEVAAAQCEERARAAQGPTGEIGVGINSDGNVSTGLSIGLSSDFIAGRDPEEVYVNCVRQKTGMDPIRPLEL